MLLHAASARRGAVVDHAALDEKFVETFADGVLETAALRGGDQVERRTRRAFVALEGAQLLLRAALLYLTASGAAAWATALAAHEAAMLLPGGAQGLIAFTAVVNAVGAFSRSSRSPCRTRRRRAAAPPRSSGTRRPSRWCLPRRRRRAGRRPLARRRRVRARAAAAARSRAAAEAAAAWQEACGERARLRMRVRAARPPLRGRRAHRARRRGRRHRVARVRHERYGGGRWVGSRCTIQPRRRKDGGGARAAPGLETRTELGSLGTIRANATASGWPSLDGVYFGLPLLGLYSAPRAVGRRVVDARAARPEPVARPLPSPWAGRLWETALQLLACSCAGLTAVIAVFYTTECGGSRYLHAWSDAFLSAHGVGAQQQAVLDSWFFAPNAEDRPLLPRDRTSLM